MRKLIAAAMVVAVFGLVGCADKDAAVKPSDMPSYTKAKCKCKHCHRKAGKFGIEHSTCDTAK